MERDDLEELASSLQRLDLRINELQNMPDGESIVGKMSAEQWRAELDKLRLEREELVVALRTARERLSATMAKVRAYYEGKRLAKRIAEDGEATGDMDMQKHARMSDSD